MQFTSYDPDLWLLPYWKGRRVYHETVLFVGKEDAAPLLYRPSEIISVRDYGLQTEYRRGKDYILTEQGAIRRLPGSSIPYFTEDEYYRKEPDSIPVSILKGADGRPFGEKRYGKYGEGDTFTSRQIVVTYAHEDDWRGTVPQGKSGRMQTFLQKLKCGERTIAVFYGDSITAGCNASGTEFGGKIPPFTPSYPEMVVGYLRRRFGAEIALVNTAVGGQNTAWGLQNAEERVIAHDPDLAVVAFGMNDPFLSVSEYREQVRGIVDRIHAKLPECAVILVATTVPNVESDWYGGNQKEYFAGLYEIEKDPSCPFVAVADMTRFHLDLLRAGKRFRDMTGNNINHPNDFLMRAYAQVLLKTLLGDAFDA